ncbi:hypothetical protein LR48_Vigan406s015000 [Vigna angularis]|nr:hypothetical protein LR48_Vigan406s015000 [Vigna angularis]
MCHGEKRVQSEAVQFVDDESAGEQAEEHHGHHTCSQTWQTLHGQTLAVRVVVMVVFLEGVAVRDMMGNLRKRRGKGQRVAKGIVVG